MFVVGSLADYRVAMQSAARPRVLPLLQGFLEMSKDPASNLVLGVAVVLDSRTRVPAQLSLQEWVLSVEYDVEPFLWSGKHMIGSEVVSGRANNSVAERGRLLLPTPLILG